VGTTGECVGVWIQYYFGGLRFENDLLSFGLGSHIFGSTVLVKLP